MIGYWDKSCPVTCTNTLVKTSVYQGKDISIIAVANWSAKNQTVNLMVDWVKLGIDPKLAVITIPDVKGFQTEQKNVTLNHLVIPGGKGFLITISSR